MGDAQKGPMLAAVARQNAGPVPTDVFMRGPRANSKSRVAGSVPKFDGQECFIVHFYTCNAHRANVKFRPSCWGSCPHCPPIPAPLSKSDDISRFSRQHDTDLGARTPWIPLNASLR